MMASAASSLPHSEREMAERFFSMASMFSLWPMTPVEHTTTSSASIPRSLAQAFASRRAFSGPSGAQALAFPELMITALARPFSRCAFVTWMGAAWTRFLVYTAAALQGTSE